MEGVLFPLFLDQFFDEMPKWDWSLASQATFFFFFGTTLSQKRAGGVAPGEDPEFKP
jgi:hypothetical protein